MTDPEETPVLIVGGGPAGLTTALELARRGIDGIVIDRRDFTTHFPRAHLLNVRTMETFTDVGIADRIYAEGPPEDQWHRVAWYTSLAGPTPLHGRRIGYLPAWGGGAVDRERYAQASPRRFGNLPQLRVDTLLWEQADKAWPGKVRPKTELVDLAVTDDGVTATVRDLVADRTYRIRARYLVGADGGRTCPGLLSVQVSGPRALVDIVSVFFSADLSAHADPEALLTYLIQPQGEGGPVGGLLALGPGRWGAQSPQWSMGMHLHPEDPIGRDPEALTQRVRDLLGLPELELTVHAISHWQYEGVVADRFRVGPVFLAGDAAHRHPPTGGLGLNTAVGDAANLGWKLAAVLKGQAGDELLDSYEPERRQIAIRNVEHSLRNAGRHAPIGFAMGLGKGKSVEEGWAEIGVWASDTEEGARRRAAVDAAVAHNAEDYSQLGIEAGFFYEVGALIGDGTVPPAGHDTATGFTPSARPGHHVPHVWLRTATGEQVSSSDLVAAEGLTLFTDAGAAEDWRAAAAGTTGCPVTVVAVGGSELADPANEWAEVAGLAAGGALLVRPDRHVAWRAPQAPADREAELGRVLWTLLHESPTLPDGDPLAGLKGIAEAGEALRVGRAREARLFTVAD
ncbi:FAD-dependent monooxygenase [Pseudonocardia yuanmonensis]|uniref:FAD-dependent monooxygenase n=1 Tax=Pseudonocardia yuanmonensis TaxID=1095914 RepID=A0ABP8X9J5_9PSEU